jgi:hypothetical protein
VAPKADTLLVNVGDYVSLMTRGRFVSPLHRVVVFCACACTCACAYACVCVCVCVCDMDTCACECMYARVVVTGPFIKFLLHNHSVIYKILIFFFRRSKRQRKF